MRHGITILLLLTFGNLFSQELKLEELLQLQKSSFDEGNDILIRKGWAFSGSKNNVGNGYKSVSWSYVKNSYTEPSSSVTSFINDKNENFIVCKFSNSNYYLSLKDAVVAFKMKIDGTTIDDNMVSTVYRGEKYTVVLSVSSDKHGSKTSYIVLLAQDTTILFTQLKSILTLANEEEMKGDKGMLLDSKVIYGKGNGSGGSSLDLAGWQWNEIPKPNLPTAESGRVVFEIKVSSDGEILSIKTIERSVSLEAENTCRKEIEKLTFSKTSTIVPAISTGKITFVIRSTRE